MKKIILSSLLTLIMFQAFSQTKIDSTTHETSVYVLGEVVIRQTIDKEKVKAIDMQKYNAHDVSTSLKMLPSVVYTNFGARNESSVYLRGFDIRSVPVFIDGIPVYVSYDGYVDLARLTTYDISKIDVSKGYSSMMYGANTIGGAINLVGLKPEKKLNISAKLGIMSGDGYDTKLNIGSNLGKFYIQTSFSLFNREFIPLSDDFKTSELEMDHRRDNSYSKDLKSSVKIGYTPNDADEYSLNYLYSHGSKGNPVYIGTDENTSARFWKWPYWDKQSLYYISKTAIGTRSFLKARMYYDQFKNKLSSYDDNSYTTQDRKYAFNSFYDDHTLGGNLEYSNDWNEDNQFRFSVHIKNDNHNEHNDGEPIRKFADNTYSIGLENVFKPSHKITLIPGVAYNLRKSLKAELYNSNDGTISDYPKNKNDAFNAQLASFYKLSNYVNINFNIAYKSRFATMKDRYSFRIGQAIPNPDLKSEKALNIELGSDIKISDNFTFRPELFYSKLNNTIQLVSNVQDDLWQMQNTGESKFSGADLSLVYRPINNMRLYTTYSFIKRENISNPDILFIDVPEHKVFASAEYTLANSLFFNLFGEYNSKRINASDGSRISPEFLVLNTQTSYSFFNYLTAEVGINNIFDKNYTIQEGYPEMGRNFYMALYFNL